MKKLICMMVAVMCAGCVTDMCSLTVNQGTGSGKYYPLKNVDISAVRPDTNMLFSVWEGDISGIGSKTASSTVISMDKLNKVVTAVFTNQLPPPPPPIVYEYIPGDRVDKGNEIWIANYEGIGMGVRLSANDVKNLNRCGIPAKGSWYPLDHGVTQNVLLKLNPDGSVTASATDFVSSRSGLKYHFCGFLVQYSESQLVQTNVLTIPKAQCNETLRFMYATVKP